MMKRLLFLAALCVVPGALAQTAYTEDFESFTVPAFGTITPDQTWYNYRAGSTGIGSVSTTAPIGGSKSFRMFSAEGLTPSDKFSDFDLEVAATVSWINFTVDARSIAQNGDGSNQVVRLESESPRRTLAEFYVICQNTTYTAGCEFRPRFLTVDTTGQVLVNASSNLTRFRVELNVDWINARYRLYVNGVNDGLFNFLELPSNFGRLRMAQVDSTAPIDLAFDNWTVAGASSETGTTLTGDAATGIQNFLQNIKFTTSGSKFVFGILLFLILMAAIIVPAFTFGKDNSISPAIGFLVVLAALWLIDMEIWPEWIGIATIVAASAAVALTGRAMIGLGNSSSGAAMVVGALGYFIIASTLLAFSGYAGQAISLPTDSIEVDDGASSLNTTDQVQQGFVEQVADCAIGIVTFGKFGDCSRTSRGTAITWAKDTVDSIGRVTAAIFGFAKAAVGFLWQLLTFQLPIPVIWNMMIVLPPAAALGFLAIQVVRGVGS